MMIFYYKTYYCDAYDDMIKRLNDDNADNDDDNDDHIMGIKQGLKHR